MLTFRDLRTPLAAGYIWLLAAWLTIRGHAPHHGPIGEVAVPLRSLFIYLGKPAALAALSFVGFVVGSSLEIRADRFWSAVMVISGKFRVRLKWTTSCCAGTVWTSLSSNATSTGPWSPGDPALHPPPGRLHGQRGIDMIRPTC